MSVRPVHATQALKEILLVEQMQRMLRSLLSLLEFEDLRFCLAKLDKTGNRKPILDHRKEILTAAIAHTDSSLMTVLRDSRLGNEFEQDYV